MTFWQSLKRDRPGMACLCFLVLVALAGLLAPYIVSYDPVDIDVRNKFAPCGWTHWLGTDHLGRDILSRLVYGTRASLGFSLLTMGITVSIGIVLGMSAGFLRGKVEAFLMRLCDVMMSFPSEVMILAIVGMLGPGLENVVLACVIAKWPWYTRMIRTVTRQYADMNYIRFARVAGYGTPYIIRRHLLPCAAGEIIVLATLDTGAVILMISALSFLGLGVQPPTPEWGMMLGEAKDIMILYPEQMLPPGITILLVVAAFNFLGDSLRDALDPWHHPSREVTV
ncbi:MAG: ABC transporter permease subunit [Desulfovibrio desulfuricans]|nr:ABC transporter permease subunit [Desulfovibrio desulfuricans]